MQQTSPAFLTLLASATVIKTDDEQPIPVGELIPARGLVALFFFEDLIHDKRPLGACRVDELIDAKNGALAEPITVLAFGPSSDARRARTAEYVRMTVKKMTVSLVKNVDDPLVCLLQAHDPSRKPTNATFLVKDGDVVWAHIPSRPDQAHDLEGLFKAVDHHATA